MPFCPKCRDEFREGFNVCMECNAPLIDKLPEEDHFASPEAMAAYLEDKEIIPVSRGSIENIKEIRDCLMAEQIACLIGKDDSSCDSTACHPTMLLFVALTDLERVREFFQQRWHQSLHLENQELVLAQHAADTSTEGADTDTCPACGVRFEPGPEAECPDCGLYLGTG